jgi:hypothetical protein
LINPKFIIKDPFIPVQLIKNEFLKEEDIDDLEPLEKNFHSIRALENCAFFDILLPHYNDSRICSYYQIHSVNSQKDSIYNLIPGNFPNSSTNIKFIKLNS